MTASLSTRLPLLAAALALYVCAPSALSQDVQYSPQGEQIPGPRCDSVPEWYGGKPRTCQPGEL